MRRWPFNRHPANLDAWSGGVSQHPWRLALLWSLLVHGALVAAYCVFFAGQTSSQPAWFQRFVPGAQEPPRPLINLIIAAEMASPGDGAQDAQQAPPPDPPAIIETEVAASAKAPEAPALPIPEEPPPPATALVTETVPLAPPTPPPSAPSEPALPVAVQPNEALASVAPHTPSAPAAAGLQAGGTNAAALTAKTIASGGTGAAVAAPAADGHTGGALAKPNFNGAQLRQPPNLQRFYPYAARAQTITGLTHLVLHIDPAGRVATARVSSSQPAGVFDQAALRAVRNLRFEPARRNNLPVAADFDLAIQWRLDP